MILLARSAVAWAACTAVLAWVPPRRFQLPLVTLSTLAFLARWDVMALAAISLQTAVVLLFLPRLRGRGLLTAAVLAVLCCVWFAFKVRCDILRPGEWVMPLGLSFMTFRLAHLSVDAYVGRLEDPRILDLVAYLFFLPVLVAGPVHRFQAFQRDLRRRRPDARMAGAGLERLLHGYAKLVILKNLLLDPYLMPWLARGIDGSFRGNLVLGLGQWISLYISFSGCADLAVGYSMLMGFRVPENFRFPFLASSLRDFWQRWHISFTAWCRDYVYAPLAALTRRPLVGVVAAMLVIGLWHALSPRYVLWGLYHAGGVVLGHLLGARIGKILPGAAVRAWVVRPLGTVATLAFVVSSFAVTTQVERWLRALVS